MNFRGGVNGSIVPVNQSCLLGVPGEDELLDVLLHTSLEHVLHTNERG